MKAPVPPVSPRTTSSSVPADTLDGARLYIRPARHPVQPLRHMLRQGFLPRRTLLFWLSGLESNGSEWRHIAAEGIVQTRAGTEIKQRR